MLVLKQLNNNLILRKYFVAAKQLLIPNSVNEGCGGAIGEKKWGGGKKQKQTNKSSSRRKSI